MEIILESIIIALLLVCYSKALTEVKVYKETWTTTGVTTDKLGSIHFDQKQGIYESEIFTKVQALLGSDRIYEIYRDAKHEHQIQGYESEVSWGLTAAFGRRLYVSTLVPVTVLINGNKAKQIFLRANSTTGQQIWNAFDEQSNQTGIPIYNIREIRVQDQNGSTIEKERSISEKKTLSHKVINRVLFSTKGLQLYVIAKEYFPVKIFIDNVDTQKRIWVGDDVTSQNYVPGYTLGIFLWTEVQNECDRNIASGINITKIQENQSSNAIHPDRSAYINIGQIQALWLSTSANKKVTIHGSRIKDRNYVHLGNVANGRHIWTVIRKKWSWVNRVQDGKQRDIPNDVNYIIEITNSNIFTVSEHSYENQYARENTDDLDELAFQGAVF